eukprot:CAMPEP_0178419552 /NCGR_PEP_ID=MMETSP0689_2-20121128/25670_1 /TAXON_ID=160604 /ORGANISM="Amphidinium massartii, Strain CS-259" /LENGTH=333 /DNA_ID=CAMNT_0020040995 /DNA_START=69 /DNA_END=1070 /DNA_ORIENTATION=+
MVQFTMLIVATWCALCVLAVFTHVTIRTNIQSITLVATASDMTDEVVKGWWSNAHRVTILERIRHSSPLVWVHTPKTGTSFWEVLMHHSGFCPNIPADLHLPPPGTKVPGGTSAKYVLEQHGLTGENWPCKGGLLEKYSHGHCPYSVAHKMRMQQKWQGNGVTMLREPRAHFISLYSHWGKGYYKYTLNQTIVAGVWCQIGMLSGTHCDSTECCMKKNGLAWDRAPSINLALQLLKSEFSFVGIQEEWSLSVCLFHAIFGGSISDHELMNARPTPVKKKIDDNDSIESKLAKDDLFRVASADLQRLYLYGTRRFNFDLGRFHVDIEKCQSWRA